MDDKEKSIVLNAQKDYKIALKIVRLLASEEKTENVVEILDIAIRLLGLNAHVSAL